MVNTPTKNNGISRIFFSVKSWLWRGASCRSGWFERHTNNLKDFKRSLEPLSPTSLFLCNYTVSISKSRREAQQWLANSVSIWQPFCFTFVTSWSHATNPIHLGIQTRWKDGLLKFKMRIFMREKEWCKWHWTRLVPDELVSVFQKLLLCWDLIYMLYNHFYINLKEKISSQQQLSCCLIDARLL